MLFDLIIVKFEGCIFGSITQKLFNSHLSKRKQITAIVLAQSDFYSWTYHHFQQECCSAYQKTYIDDLLNCNIVCKYTQNLCAGYKAWNIFLKFYCFSKLIYKTIHEKFQFRIFKGQESISFMAAKSKMLLLKTTFNDKLAFKAHIDDVKKNRITHVTCYKKNS